MKDFEENLRNLVLAPYISRATALIGIQRDIGGNAFRHQMACLAILIDYKYSDSILLKASVIHDLLEDIQSTDISEIRSIDPEANQVVNLVEEVTKKQDELKNDYLQRILETGSTKAKILKVADRIANLIEITSDLYSKEKIDSYLEQTKKYIIPIARQVNQNMFIELNDLVKKRKSLCR